MNDRARLIEQTAAAQDWDWFQEWLEGLDDRNLIEAGRVFGDLSEDEADELEAERRRNATPRYIYDGGDKGLDASIRLNGGYPATPELVGEAVDELRAQGRDDDAEHVIYRHPSAWEAARDKKGDDSPHETETDTGRALSPAEVRKRMGAETKADRFNAAIRSEEPRQFDPESAVDRINGGYPPTPTLISEAVAELRAAGRDDDARRLINQHPGLWAVSGGDDGEDHSHLDPDAIRSNATGETDDTEGWQKGDPFQDLAPQHPWLDVSEWDVKRERDDLDGDED